MSSPWSALATSVITATSGFDTNANPNITNLYFS